MSSIVEKGRRIVTNELRKLGLQPNSDSLNSKIGPIKIDYPKSMSFQIRTSAGANEPRRWDAGRIRQENISDAFYYIFVIRWKDESKPYELFVVPSKYVYERATNEDRPKFNMNEEDTLSFKNNWEPVKRYLK
jgi:hypothetical protein